MMLYWSIYNKKEINYRQNKKNHDSIVRMSARLSDKTNSWNHEMNVFKLLFIMICPTIAPV